MTRQLKEGMAAYDREDFVAAIRLLRPIAEQGNADAQYTLGLMCENGEGVRQDYLEAIHWYSFAAEQGKADAQYNLGVMYYSGQGVRQDYKRAIHWFGLAAEQANSDAQYNLGLMNYRGEGVHQNYGLAFYWFSLSAAQGQSDGQFYLGLLYDSGKGVPQNSKQAVHWYHLSAEQGNLEAQNNLAWIYYYGEGVPQDYKQAFKWYFLSAKQGDSIAQNNLGLMLENGEGVPQNHKQALSWYRLSAEQGNAGAQYNLALMYENGKGVSRDYKQALHWYNLSAEQGDDMAAYNIGLAYDYGRGVPFDKSEAIRWFKLAASRGNKDAKMELKSISDNASKRRKIGNREGSKQSDFVQSFITAIGFPHSPDELRSYLSDAEAEEDKEQPLLESLLQLDNNQIVIWTVPKWADIGDVVLFYQTQKSYVAARSIMSKLKKGQTDEPELMSYLSKSVNLLEKYSGKVCVLGTVIDHDDTEYRRGGKYWKDRIYAKIGNIFLINNLPDSDKFKSLITIRRQATITHVTAGQYKEFIHYLKRIGNQIPDVYFKAKIGLTSVDEFDPKRWKELGCSDELRFLNENVLREYFIDYLLMEIMDSESELLKECTCYRDGQRTGVADYFISIKNEWFPVEAKLAMFGESAIIDQINQYLHVDQIKPSVGASRNLRISVHRPKMCLIVDQYGLYIADEQGFVECDDCHPLIHRIEVAELSARAMRERINKVLASRKG